MVQVSFVSYISRTPNTVEFIQIVHIATYTSANIGIQLPIGGVSSCAFYILITEC